jgi:hypothetical protein
VGRLAESKLGGVAMEGTMVAFMVVPVEVEEDNLT